MVDTSARLAGRVYLWLVPLGGLATLAWAIRDLGNHPPSPYWIGLAVLTALTGSFTVQIPGMVARLSVSEPFVFASALLFGPAAGTVTVAVDALVMSMRLLPGIRTVHRVLFNVGTLAVSVALSSTLFFRLSGIDPRTPSYTGIAEFVWPLYGFAGVCFFLNSGLVAIALGFERRASPVQIWRRQFMWVSLNYLAGASVAALIVIYSRTVDPAILAIVVPLIAISYATFRTTLGRLDDANRHLSEVNALHLSTIETLAMAIDAKDQVTHGHIRRVQRFAVGLAKALGMTDERQVRAIEAAALLHDMGKLAIPEFILNKPGKLSTSEFAVMKTHAAVGADLLSSIRFPYPVVPIVRHHHENWDGTGYPDGIKGTDIPIGARILSVVDCFDALTSDRPYRPALSTEQALEILTQRRGRMYDPLVVDTFVHEHATLSLVVEPRQLPAAILANQVERPAVSDSMASDVSPAESLRLLADLSPYPGGPPLASVCRNLIEYLRCVLPFDTAVVFLPDAAGGALVPVYVNGPSADAITDLRIAVGDRMSGWVAAHRTAIWNSDASLDLGQTTARSLTLGSGVPMAYQDSLVAVLAVYGQPDHEVSVAQRRGAEALMPTAALRIAEALDRPSMAIDCRDEHTCAATLAVLDAVMSHDRQSIDAPIGAVLAVTATPTRSDAVRRLSQDADLTVLIGELCPAPDSSRCVAFVGAGLLLYFSLDGAASWSLEEELAALKRSPRLQGLDIVSAQVKTSLELQDAVRRARASAKTTVDPIADIIH